MAAKSGFRPGRYDSRDYIFSARSISAKAASASRCIIEHDVPVIDQGRAVPCCVSISVTTCLEALDQNAGTPLSFMYNYYCARTYNDRLSALDIREGLDAAASYGICTKNLHNATIDRAGATVKPSQAADNDALRRRIAYDPASSSWAYEHFQNNNRVDDWRNSIQQGSPVIMGFELTDAYNNIPKTNNTHGLPVNSVSFDGHAVTIMGYDNEHDNGQIGAGAFFVRDSRGSGFADSGYWWLPYELVETHLVVDSWTVLSLTETN